MSGSQAVHRALSVLQCFRDNAPALSASDLARRLDLPTSTAHRLARALVDQGFLEQDPQTSRYRLGPAITELGQLSFHQRGLHRAAPELEQLTRITGATVDLAIRSGGQAVILAGGSVRENGFGLRRPLHSTALGKVLLAWDPTDLDTLGPLTALTARTIVHVDDLRIEVARVRRLGYALNDRESSDGIRTLAVPVLDRYERVHCAVAARSTPEVLTDARLGWFLAHIRDCARALEVLLLPPASRAMIRNP
jgi:DNA-binding IclR family transcriptional regulator